MLRWLIKRRQVRERRRKDVVLSADIMLARWGQRANAACERESMQAVADGDGFRLEHWVAVRREVRRRLRTSGSMSKTDEILSI